MLEAVNISKTYGAGDAQVRALAGVSLSVPGGSYVAITGPSGSGKSTLMQQLGLLDRPTSGEVVVDGESAAGLSDHELAALRRRKLGFIFQSFHLLPGLAAWENVALPGLLDGERAEGLKSRAIELLDGVGLEHRVDHRPAQMSGGERQRVAIARALFAEPMVVLADEPTGALDTDTSDEVMAVLEAATVEAGKSLVIVTHEPEVAQRAATQVYIRDGRVV